MTDLWLFQWGALSLFLFFGFLSSILDFRTRRVSNHLIFAVLLWVIGLLLWEAVFKRANLPMEWPKFLLIHLALCGATSSILWYQRIWPAGDAKLFFIFSALMVMVRPWLWGFPYWTFLDLMINIFLPAACFILVVLLYDKFLEIKRLSLMGVKNWSSEILRVYSLRIKQLPTKKFGIFFFIGNLLVIPALIESPRGVVPLSWLKPIQFAACIFFYLFWGPLSKHALRKAYLFIILGLLLVVLAAKSHQSVLGIIFKGIYFSTWFIVFALSSQMLSFYLKYYRVRTVFVSDLKMGDILNDLSWNNVIQLCAAIAPEHEFRRYADGLSQEDITAIRGCCPAEKEVIVCETRPFAFWIFFGVLWTLFVNQTFPQWLISLWRARF